MEACNGENEVPSPYFAIMAEDFTNVSTMREISFQAYGLRDANQVAPGMPICQNNILFETVILRDSSNLLCLVM
jgi:hypothetical protein